MIPDTGAGPIGAAGVFIIMKRQVIAIQNFLIALDKSNRGDYQAEFGRHYFTTTTGKYVKGGVFGL